MNEKELRRLINEITTEIIVESQINPGDGEFTEEEGRLLQQLSDDAAEEESLEDDDHKATHFSDHPENDEYMAWANDAAVLMNDPKITQAKDIPNFTDAYGDPELNSWDEYKRGTSSKEYASLVDQYQSGGVWSDKRDYEAGFMSESKEFTFDKFMKDINSREDKIEQHKKELTENEGDTNARLKQKLYQEDWRNSVKFKGNK
jgi:hypothetical protein